MLAERKDHVAAILFGIGLIDEFETTGRGAATQEIAHSVGYRCVRERAQGARHVHDVPNPADVGERDEQMAFVLGGAQRAHHLAVIDRAIAARAQGRQACRQALFGIGRKKPRKAFGIGLRKTPQIRRMVCETKQQGGDGLAFREGCQFTVRSGDEVLHLLARERRVSQLGR